MNDNELTDIKAQAESILSPDGLNKLADKLEDVQKKQPGVIDRYLLTPVKAVFNSEPVQAVYESGVEQGKYQAVELTANVVNEGVFTFLEEFFYDEESTAHGIVRSNAFQLGVTGAIAFGGTFIGKRFGRQLEDSGHEYFANMAYAAAEVATAMFVNKGGDILKLEDKAVNTAHTFAVKAATFLRKGANRMEERKKEQAAQVQPSNRQQFKGNKR